MPVSRSSASRSTDPRRENRRQLARYLDTLFGDRSGWVGCGLGVGGHFTPGKRGNPTYTLRSIQHEYFLWPDDRSVLIGWVMEKRTNYDVFINPILRSEESLGEDHAAAGTHIWCDIDIDLESEFEILSEIEQLLTRRSMVIWSGGRRAAHLYLELDHPYSPETIKELNRALRDFVNWTAEPFTTGRADNKIATNAFLRPPGSLNMKGRAKPGSRPFPVLLGGEEHAGTAWTADGLMERLRLPSSVTKARAKPTLIRKSPKRVPVLEPIRPAAVPGNLPPELRKLTGFYEPKGADKSRSAQLYGLLTAAIEQGYSDDELLVIGQMSEAAQERARERAGERWRERLTSDILRCIGVLRPEHDHEGFFCGEVGCQSGDPMTVGKTQEMWAHFVTHYRPRGKTRITDRLVFEAFISVAQKTGSLDVDMSIRRLSDEAGRAPHRVWKALQRIKKAGYLHQLDEPHRGTSVPPHMLANTYHLNWENCHSSTHTNHETPTTKNVGMCTNFNGLGHDAARSAGLGNAFAAYQGLASGLDTVVEIADYIGLSVTTATKHLKKLAAHALAEQKPDGTWISHRRSWDDVADELGTVGTGAGKKAHHQRDRVEYRAGRRQACLDARAAWNRQMTDRGFIKGRGCMFVPPNSPYLKKDQASTDTRSS
jgi:DNA-binding transcriptional ArsR family regulator